MLVFTLVHKQMLNLRFQRFTPDLRSFLNITIDTSLLSFVTDIHLVVIIDILHLCTSSILLIKEL